MQYGIVFKVSCTFKSINLHTKFYIVFINLTYLTCIYYIVIVLCCSNYSLLLFGMPV